MLRRPSERRLVAVLRRRRRFCEARGGDGVQQLAKRIDDQHHPDIVREHKQWQTPVRRLCHDVDLRDGQREQRPQEVADARVVRLCAGLNPEVPAALDAPEYLWYVPHERGVHVRDA